MKKIYNLQEINNSRCVSKINSNEIQIRGKNIGDNRMIFAGIKRN